MHASALDFGKRFFDTYCKNQTGKLVVDIGSQNVNGSLKQVCPYDLKYIGVDFCAGKGVDIILTDPYKLPFEDSSVDVVVCSSVFEHSQFFWVVFLEIMRVLKPKGLFYLNAPSNGYIHRYPVDCWRFYPDSGHALVAWAERNGYNPALLESFVGEKNCLSIEGDAWNDFVAVFIKEAQFRDEYQKRIVQSVYKYANAYCDDDLTEIKANSLSDDFLIIKNKNLEIAQFQESAKERDHQIVILELSLVELEKLKDKLNHINAAHEDLIASQEHAVALIQDKDAQLNLIYSSLSWRITKPLRKIKAFLFDSN